MKNEEQDQTRVDTMSDPRDSPTALDNEVLDGPWGYACVENGAVWVPVVVASEEWPLRRVLAHLHEATGLTRIIFSAVLNAESLKSHLRNIVREWDEYFPEVGDSSRCIEIAYEPPQADPAVESVVESGHQ